VSWIATKNIVFFRGYNAPTVCSKYTTNIFKCAWGVALYVSYQWLPTVRHYVL